LKKKWAGFVDRSALNGRWLGLTTVNPLVATFTIKKHDRLCWPLENASKIPLLLQTERLHSTLLTRYASRNCSIIRGTTTVAPYADSALQRGRATVQEHEHAIFGTWRTRGCQGLGARGGRDPRSLLQRPSASAIYNHRYLPVEVINGPHNRRAWSLSRNLRGELRRRDRPCFALPSLAPCGGVAGNDRHEKIVRLSFLALGSHNGSVDARDNLLAAQNEDIAAR